MGKALDLILLGRPGVATSIDMETFGSLVLWIDDGNFTTAAGEMDSITNQAAASMSSPYIATPANYPLVTDANGSGRTAFSHLTNSQGCAAVTSQDFTGPMTVAFVQRTLSASINAGYAFSRGITSQFGGHYAAATTGRCEASYPNASNRTQSNVALTDDVWSIIIAVIEGGSHECYIDAADERINAVEWNGVGTWEIQDVLGGGSSARFDTLGVYVYAEAMALPNINTLGQALADEFNFTQTWSL